MTILTTSRTSKTAFFDNGIDGIFIFVGTINSPIKTFAISSVSISGVNPISYDGTWDVDPDYGEDVYIHYDGTGSYRDVDGLPMPANTLLLTNCLGDGSPTWDEIPNIVWIGGQLVSGDLKDHVTDPDPGTTIFTIDPATISPTGGFPVIDETGLPMVLNPDGTYTGTISEGQGGDYNMVFDSTNSYASSKGIMNMVVELQYVDPVLLDIPDLPNEEVGTTKVVRLDDFVIDDGDPFSQGVTWLVDPLSDPLPQGWSLSGNILTMHNEIATPATVLVLRAVNQGFGDANEESIVTITDTGAVPPVPGGWFFGNTDCDAAIAPTWIPGDITFFMALNDRGDKTIDLNGWIASDGGAPIDLWTEIAPNLPDGFTLDANTGIITGSHTEVAPIVKPNTFAAQGVGGTSDPSPIFTWDIWDDAGSIPILESIIAVVNSNDVTVRFSESIYTAAGTDASYNEGLVFRVNGLIRNHSIKDGHNSPNLIYTLDGSPFSEGNNITATYTEV